MSGKASSSMMPGNAPQGTGRYAPAATGAASSSSSSSSSSSRRRPLTPLRPFEADAPSSSTSTSARSTSASSAAFFLPGLPFFAAGASASSSRRTTSLPLASSSETTSLSPTSTSKSDFSRSVSDSRATASDPESAASIGGISKSVSKMSPFSASASAAPSAACSMLEPPESSRVNSNSLSESGSTLPFIPPSLTAEAAAEESRVSSKSTSESLSVLVAPALDADLSSSLPFPFSSEMPLSAGSRRLMPLSVLRLPLLPEGSFGVAPSATSSLESVLSFSSKSSLSASRLSSNSLLSPPPGLERFLEASAAESLPDDDFPDLGADSLDELPPLITALPGPAKSIAISSVGTTASSLPSLGFLGLAGSSRASLSGLPGFFGSGRASSAAREKMSSSLMDNGRGS